VCIVDTSGRIIQSYGGSYGKGVGHLDGPRQLAVDRHGNVLVTDRDNERIVFLSPSLIYLCHLNTERILTALHLDELTHRLYIGEWDKSLRTAALPNKFQKY